MVAAPAPAQPIRLHLATPQDTDRLARWFATRLGAGDTILLDGPIGAGKSHFSRSLIRSRLATLGRIEDVPSPTFTIVQTYDAGPVEIWHTDLYRIGGPEEVAELGLDEAFDSAICLVEWPDRLGALRPTNALELRLFHSDGGEARIAEVSATAARWLPVLAALGGREWRADD